jgi:hypothetical protein
MEASYSHLPVDLVQEPEKMIHFSVFGKNPRRKPVQRERYEIDILVDIN